jgi:hypothetical protein
MFKSLNSLDFNSDKLRAGIIGIDYIEPIHIDVRRRLGNVAVLAIAKASFG